MTTEPHAPCDFCDIISGTEPARVVWRGAAAIAFLPLNPATRGHVLVVSITHYATLLDMDEPAVRDLSAATLTVARGVSASLGPEGLNLIQSNGAAATQTVEHVHVHVLPRWSDDGMPDLWPAATDTPAATLDAIAETLRQELTDTE